MPKIKTKKSIKKRFKVTAGGLILRGHQASRHRHSHKSKRRIRHFSEPIKLATKTARVIKSIVSS